MSARVRERVSEEDEEEEEEEEEEDDEEAEEEEGEEEKEEEEKGQGEGGRRREEINCTCALVATRKLSSEEYYSLSCAFELAKFYDAEPRQRDCAIIRPGQVRCLLP